NLKTFEDFIKEGIVKKITPDIERAKNLILESERKQKVMNEMIKNIGIDDSKANDYIEYCYNIIMFLLRAHMLKNGFTSTGIGAHEAEVSFAEKLGFTEKEISLLDQLIYFRNGILYYGKRFDKEYAEKIIKFTINKYLKLKELFKK
ncbi:MAG: hypothetical protein QW757_05845, partial [Candidatus Woesearchaeota archaeon]